MGPFDLALARRAMVTSSSCGICGTESIDQLLTCTTPMAQDSGPVIDAATLLTVSDSARSLQPTFDRTGGLHAAALFDADGKVSIVREDIGRHNAVDKVIGRSVLDGKVPLSSSNLAVQTADALGMTLVGFLRDGRANVYTHAHRVRM
ncbi:MAG: hypothetical protein EBY89_07060 [Actinobacteria bacterium]|nr:hypothetical protein [Actinomycetota bacterium]